MVSVRICAQAARGVQAPMITIISQASLLAAAHGLIGFNNFTPRLRAHGEYRTSDRGRISRPSAVAGRLELEHLRVASANLQKLFVVSLFGNTSIFKDEDSICHFDSREAMGNQ